MGRQILICISFNGRWKIFITNIYHSVSIEALKKNISRLVYPIIYEEISNMAKNLNEDDKVFITNFYKCAFVSIILNWIENNMNENFKDIVNKVSNLVTGSIKHACLAINSNIWFIAYRWQCLQSLTNKKKIWI